MTDDEVFSAICADFPFNSATLRALHRRLRELQAKRLDGTIGPASMARLRQLTGAMTVLIRAMEIIETDALADDDDIPF